MINLFAALALFVPAPQDELDAALEQLAGTLAPDGPSGRLAGLLRTAAGRQAVRERVDFLTSAVTGRIDRDRIGAYEDHLFRADENGFLHARPERTEEFRRLSTAVAAAPKAMAGFNRRADLLVARMAQAADIDRRARAFWSDPGFRRAFFQPRHEELRELDDEEFLSDLFLNALERREDGALRLGGERREEILGGMQIVHAQLESIQAYEKAYLKAVVAEPDPARRTRAAENDAAAFILGRLLRQLQEGAESPIGSLGEAENPDERTVTLARPLAELLQETDHARDLGRRLGAILDKAAADLSGGGDEEKELAGLLRNPRARMLLWERILELRHSQNAQVEKVFQQIREDGFEGTGELLWVKKGRYVDEQGQDSADVLEQEYRQAIEAFHETRRPFDLLAERCADPAAAAIFESADGTFALQRQVDEIAEALLEAARQEGLDRFTRLYLEKKGEVLIVLPIRAGRIDALARRAEMIK